jgi:hypothetical protein
MDHEVSAGTPESQRAQIGTPGGRRHQVHPQHAAVNVPTPGQYPLFETAHGNEVCEHLTDIHAELIKTQRKIPQSFTLVVIITAGILLAFVGILIVLLVGLVTVAQFEDDSVQESPETSEFHTEYGVTA